MLPMGYLGADCINHVLSGQGVWALFPPLGTCRLILSENYNWHIRCKKKTYLLNIDFSFIYSLINIYVNILTLTYFFKTEQLCKNLNKLENTLQYKNLYFIVTVYFLKILDAVKYLKT